MLSVSFISFVHLFLFSFPQNYDLLLRIVREGGHRGLTECQHQFKNEIWNCSLGDKNVHKQLPIFVKTTLTDGRLDLKLSLSLF